MTIIISKELLYFFIGFGLLFLPIAIVSIFLSIKKIRLLKIELKYNKKRKDESVNQLKKLNGYIETLYDARLGIRR